MQRLLAALFTILPHHFISRVVFHLTRVEKPWFKNLLIRNYLRLFDIDMRDALEPNPFAYPSMNAFFTRALKADARPLAEGNVLVSPVDGTISQLGDIQGDQIFQAKGIDYSLERLVGDATLAQPFREGGFATIYLSPRDYHRIHMPLDGTLTDMIHIPGRLFSVAPFSVNHIGNLFARNERVVCLFDTAIGRLAVILVGAINVAAIETTWAGLVTPPPGKTVRHTRYDNNILLRRGMEMGRFNMGSTVILLTEKEAIQWLPELTAGQTVRLGQALTQNQGLLLTRQ